LPWRKPGYVLFGELRHLTLLEFGAAEVVWTVNALRVEQSGEPFAAGKAFEIGSRSLVLRLVASAVVALVSVTTGAIFGEEFRALGERVVTEQCHGAFTRNSRGRSRENFDTFGVAPRFLDSSPKRRVPPVLGYGQERQEDHPTQQREREPYIESMPQIPPADDRHEKDDQHDQAGDDDGAPDFRPTREKFEELKKEQEIPFRTGGRIGLGGIGRGGQFRAQVFARVE